MVRLSQASPHIYLGYENFFYGVDFFPDDLWCVCLEREYFAFLIRDNDLDLPDAGFKADLKFK